MNPPGHALPSSNESGIFDFFPRMLPGEHVVYFRPTPPSVAVLWLFGILLLPVLIGLIFIYLAITAHQRHPRAIVLTNFRLTVLHGGGRVDAYMFDHYVDVTAKREHVRSGGGGLIGALVAVGVSAVADSMAAKKEKTTQGYWSRVNGVVVHDAYGRTVTIEGMEQEVLMDIGMKLAWCVVLRQAGQFPPIDASWIEPGFVADRKRSRRRQKVGAMVSVGSLALIGVGVAGFLVYDDHRLAQLDSQYEARRVEREKEQNERERKAEKRKKKAQDDLITRIPAQAEKLGFSLASNDTSDWSSAPRHAWTFTHPDNWRVSIDLYDFQNDGAVEVFPSGYSVEDGHAVVVELQDSTATIKQARTIARELNAKRFDDKKSAAAALEKMGWKIDPASNVDKPDELIVGIRFHLLFADKESTRITVHILNYAEAAAKKSDAAVLVRQGFVVVVSTIGAKRMNANSVLDLLLGD